MRLELSRRLAVSLTLGMALSLATALPIAAAPTPRPPTLTGEQLVQIGGGDALCATSGTFTLSATGPATGAYLGTFSEQVNGTISGSPGSQTVTAFNATFTITSGTTTITGSKKLQQSIDGCYQDGTHWIADEHTTYEAIIHTPTGNYLDRGTSIVSSAEGSSPPPGLGETFTSSLTQTTLIVPTSEDQCKGNGWQNYPQFKNKGQCVSFVETGK